MATTRILSPVALTFALVFGMIASVSLLPAVGTSLAEEAAREYVLGVEGMSCPVGCAPKVKETLESVDGVESVTVNFDEKQAVVHMAPGQSLTQESCDKALGNSGYWISSFAEKSGADSEKSGS